MSTTIFRGAEIRGVRMSFNKARQPIYNIDLAADWTDTVRSEMGWDADLPLWVEATTSLSGEIPGQKLSLTPDGGELKDYAIEVPINSVRGFQLITKKSSGDVEKTERYLKFDAACSPLDEIVVAAIHRYCQRVGPVKGQLRVMTATQADLPFNETTEVEAEEPAGDESVEQHLTGPALEAHDAKTGRKRKGAPAVQ